MKNIFDAPFLTEIIRTTSNMYRLGWDECNSGNISYLLGENETGQYIALNNVIRSFSLNIDAKKLSGKIFLVTGAGKHFRNVQYNPEENLGIVRISNDGRTAELLWGLSGGGRPTSELSPHLMCHIARLSVNPENRIILHAHPVNLTAMTYIHSIDEKKFTHTLWQFCYESIGIFPDGIGVLPWMLSGTNELAEATAKKIEEFRLVVWAQHGIAGAGASFDEAFGLIETSEKAAEIYIKVMHMPDLNIPSDAQITALAERWNVCPRKGWLN
ncbi:MAG: rhamnulose-1-phosphate aldolase [Treponema sp.]|nr:rhamnulose-1-phosphate aldolase [Treponema sp.]